MKNIHEEISRFAKREKEEAEKAVQTEENQVCIKADSYIAKEIKYQTALLHQILNRLDEISLLKKKEKRRKEKMRKKNRKKKQTASGEKQSISYNPLIIGTIPIGQSNDVFNKQVQIIKRAFKSLMGGQSDIF